MKLDRRNPNHWIVLAKAVTCVLLALPIRSLVRTTMKKPVIVFYGHKLNGNLLPLYRHWGTNEDLDVYFVTLDKNYAREVRGLGFGVLNATRLRDVIKVAAADVFVSDHGLHHFSALRRYTNMKFVHVLHGIPYKGYNQDDFRHLHEHDQIWVSSEHMAKMHINKFGFKPDQVKVTGFARTEDLARYERDKAAIVKRYGLNPSKKTVLVAPTWRQDDNNRDVVPFGLSLRSFMDLILDCSASQDVQVVFRAHLNADVERSIGGKSDIHILPYVEHPVAEEFLAISDVLITDWSSIGFDFLTTRRPIIYLDVPAPFKKGFSVDEKYRPGEVVGSVEELKSAIKSAVTNPNEFMKTHRDIIDETIAMAFGSTLDGMILERSDDLLSALLNGNQGQKI